MRGLDFDAKTLTFFVKTSTTKFSIKGFWLELYDNLFLMYLLSCNSISLFLHAYGGVLVFRKGWVEYHPPRNPTMKLFSLMSKSE